MRIKSVSRLLAIGLGIALVTSNVRATRPLRLPGPFVSTSKAHATHRSPDGLITTTDAETWREARNGRRVHARSHIIRTDDRDGIYLTIDDTLTLDVVEAGGRGKSSGARAFHIRFHVVKGQIVGTTRQDLITTDYIAADGSVLSDPPITVSTDLTLEQLGQTLTPQQRASYMDANCENCAPRQQARHLSFFETPVHAQFIFCLQYAVRQCYYWLFFGPEAFDLCAAIWASICYFVETSGAIIWL